MTFKVFAEPGSYFEPGITEATVEVTTSGNLGTFAVRLKHHKTMVSLPLHVVAKSVLQKVAAMNAGAALEPPRRRR